MAGLRGVLLGAALGSLLIGLGCGAVPRKLRDIDALNPFSDRCPAQARLMSDCYQGCRDVRGSGDGSCSERCEAGEDTFDQCFDDCRDLARSKHDCCSACLGS